MSPAPKRDKALIPQQAKDAAGADDAVMERERLLQVIDERDYTLAASRREVERLALERDKAVEVADAQTKGVYSKFVAEVTANLRSHLRHIGDLEQENERLREALRELLDAHQPYPAFSSNRLLQAHEAARAALSVAESGAHTGDSSDATGN